MTASADQSLEDQIAQWRAYLRRRQAFHLSDVEELEGHLRDQLAALIEAGLTGEEAFLVAPPDFFDGLQLLLVVSALLADGVALAAIAARISEFGFTPNRVAAPGENFILLVNLASTAWLYARFARRRAPFAVLERWQTAYLPVYAVWEAIVVTEFPPLFGYR